MVASVTGARSVGRGAVLSTATRMVAMTKITAQIA